REPTLGQTALPLIALQECTRLGRAPRAEKTLPLARFILELQREDGSFYPRFDTKLKRATGDGEAMFAAGQAVYALVLTEEELAQSGADGPLLEKVRAGIDRAMDYYSGPYWNRG